MFNQFKVLAFFEFVDTSWLVDGIHKYLGIKRDCMDDCGEKDRLRQL